MRGRMLESRPKHLCSSLDQKVSKANQAVPPNNLNIQITPPPACSIHADVPRDSGASIKKCHTAMGCGAALPPKQWW